MAIPHLQPRHSVLISILCVSLVFSICAVPLVAAVRHNSRDLQRHVEPEPSRQAAGPVHYPDILSGKLIPYTWGFGGVTQDLYVDAARYEDELSALFDGPLSDWQVLPRVRPARLPL